MFKIRSSDIVDGLGVFTISKYKKGDVVLKLTGEIVNSPTRESIEIGENKHIIDPIGSFVNHSFEPNTYVNKEESSLIAKKDILPEEELTFNYNISETCMKCPFTINGKAVRGSKGL